MKRILIAAATAAVLATSALAGVAPVNAAEAVGAGVIQVGGYGDWNGGGNWHNGRDQWNGGNDHWNNGHWNNGPRHWNGGRDKWQGPKKWKARKSCDPIVSWRMVGPRWHQRWEQVIVGYDCNRHRKHW